MRAPLAFVVALLAASLVRADSITAEEIEVPPPEWSVFYREPEPEPPALVAFEPPPVELEEGPPLAPPPSTPPPSGPPAVPPIGPPIVVVPPLCWLPFVSCGGGDDRPPRPPRPPTGPPSAPVPEPTAALVFGVALYLVAKRRENV